MTRWIWLALLFAMGAPTTHAVNVTYSTTSTQLCVGASGCGVNTQTIDNIRITYEPVTDNTVDANPSVAASLGRITVTCTLPFPPYCLYDRSLDGVNLYIVISQSAPSSGSTSVVVGRLSGTVYGAPAITWSFPNAATIGSATYRTQTASIALSEGSATTINATVTVPGTPPTLTYTPPTSRAVVLPKIGNGSIAIAASGASNGGSATVSGCALDVVPGGSFIAPSLLPANGIFNAATSSGSITVSCSRRPNITTARLTCTETPSDTNTPVQREWQLVCPSVGIEGLDVDGNGSYSATTDGVLIVRYLLGIRGATLIQNAVGANPARVSAPAIESYLQAVTQ